MPTSSTTPEREAAKARFRAKFEALRQMTAREYLANLLHATNTHADAEAILDRLHAEVLREVADMADPAAPEVSFFGGEVGPAVAAWLRMLADRKAGAR